MKFIAKQLIGILIFINVIFVVQPDNLSLFIQKMDFRAMSPLQQQMWAGFFAAWFVMWNLFLFSLKRKNKQVHNTITAVANGGTGHVPPKMKVVSSAVLRMDAQTGVPGMSPGVNVASQTPMAPQAPMSPPPAITPDTQLEKDLVELSNGFWGDLKLGCFTHIVYGGVNIDLAYSTDDCAVVVKVLSEDGVWNVEPSTGNFINGSKIEPAPVAVLKKQVDVLHQIEEGAKIIPVVLLMRGTIQNAEIVLPYLQQNGVVCARFNESVPLNVPLLSQLIKDNFSVVIQPLASEQEWEELDEREELEMLRVKQEANYAQENGQKEEVVGSQQ